MMLITTCTYSLYILIFDSFKLFQYIIEKITSSTKSSPQYANKLFCNAQEIKIKVIDSSGSETKLYSTFVVDSMASNIALISDRHIIKSVP